MQISEQSVLVLACGALAHEIEHLKRLNGWSQLKLQCLPAELHNRPERIPGELEKMIERYKNEFEHIYIGYADCGTGGLLDALIERYDLQRLPGAHCYAFFAGLKEFEAFSAEHLGTLYLTDFLARNFERLLIRDLKIDKHPELKDMYFGNYTHLMYLSQIEDAELYAKAEAAARRLGLEFCHRHVGYGELATGIEQAITIQEAGH